MGRPDVLVVGAGVTGLTTAVHLAERQYAVHLIADRHPGRTASAAAGAIWGPYLVDDPLRLRWAETTRVELESIAEHGGTGVRMTSGLEVSVKPEDPPQWATVTRGYRPCTEAELEPFRPTYRSGWYYTVPLVDMPAYLDYLADRGRAAGATMDLGHAPLASLDEVRDRARFVVNCTGLGARELVPDATMYAIRGELVVLENPGIEEFFQENAHGHELTYIFPHREHVLLGGCAVDHSESWEPQPEIAAAILERCIRIEPRLRGARIIGHRIGLRPARPRPRVEIDERSAWLLHNYGHGATGVSLSWGCAEEVGRLLQ